MSIFDMLFHFIVNRE